MPQGSYLGQRATAVYRIGVSLQALYPGVTTGIAVERWQAFLRGENLPVVLTGTFDMATEAATRKFQLGAGLKPDGIVGGRTYGVAMGHGFPLVSVPGEEFPPKPENLKRLRGEARVAAFGTFPYRLTPTESNPEQITLTPEQPRGVPKWVRENIVTVDLTLLRVRGLHRTGLVHVHKRAAASFEALWAEWERLQLVSRIQTWNGSFATRLTRGGTTLSMHCYAAFDINAKTNGLGVVPPLLGEPGCVRELVESANTLGWWWGGHNDHPDGMHWEVTEAGLV